MQHPNITLIASAILLSISTSWASEYEMMAEPRFAPPPEVLPIPIPEPPHPQVRQPAPATNPVPLLPELHHPGQRPVPAIDPVPLP